MRVSSLPLIALSLAVACRSSTDVQVIDADHPVTLSVGADGGSVTADGLVMNVPAGAVDADVTLTAYPTNRVIDGVASASPTWTFGPEGQTFKTPISVSLSFSGQPGAATIWWTQEGDLNTFSNLVTEVSGGWAKAGVLHFSEGAVGDEECGGSGDGGDDADTGEHEDTGEEADTGENEDTGEEAGGEGESGHHDEGDDDGEHADDDGDGGEHGTCEHHDHGDDDGGDEADTGEAD